MVTRRRGAARNGNGRGRVLRRRNSAMRRASFRKANSVDDITSAGDLRSYVDMNRDTLLED